MKYSLLLFSLFFICLEAFSQDEIRFQNLTVEDGLSMGTITAIQKDKNGFIWLATAEGLHRFDGKEFKIFKHEDNVSGSLSDSYIRCLYAQDNQLFIGNHSGGIDIMDINTHKFEHVYINELDSNFDYPISQLLPFKEHLLIVTSGGGIWAMHPQTKALQKIDFENLPKSADDVIVLNDHFYVVAQSKIFKCNKEDYSLVFTNGNLELTSIAAHQNQFLIGTNTGILSASAQFDQIKQVPIPQKKRNASRITTIKSDGKVAWIGSQGGVMRFVNNQIELYRNDVLRPFSVVSNNIQSVFIDDIGIVWVGTIAGLSRYSPQLKKFNLLQYFDWEGKTYRSIVYSIYQDQLGVIWLGTLSSGLVKLKKDNSIDKIYPIIKDGEIETRGVRSIFEDSKNNLWIGTSKDGLFKFNRETEKFTLVASTANGKIADNVIRAIYEDRDGLIWIGTQAGLYSHNTETGNFEHFFADNRSRANNYVYQIEDVPNSNQLLVGCFRGGLQYFDKKTKEFEILKHNSSDSNSLSSNNVMCFTRINEDTILIGTYGGGLNIYNVKTKQFSHVTEKHGLINNAVYGILYEGNGNCWLSTNNGLVNYNIYSSKFRNFKTVHYLQSTEFNEGAFLKAKNGMYYFGGVNGINYFRPTEIKYDSVVPRIWITELKGQYENKSDDQISMSYLNSRLEIGFKALNYVNPNGIKYRYKLEGYDNDWIEKDVALNAAVYPRLSPGNYTFLVEAEDEFGAWKSSSNLLRVGIKPPFWQSWWFILLAALVSLGIIYMILRYRTSQIDKTYKLQLLDSELAALRSQMNPHFIFNSLNSIQYFILKKEPKEAYSYLSKFASLMRKILQNSRLKYISVHDEVEWLNLYLEMEKMRMDNNLDYTIKTKGISSKESTYIPTMLIQPFVENSIIHGLLPKEKDRSLDVMIELQEKGLTCTISDNGIGRVASRKMNSKRTAKHNSAGMALTQKRLEILSEGKGRFGVKIKDLEEQGESFGTLVEIVIPLIRETD